ncbi:MAG: transglutaminase domain-containing protein, partial [Hadesarchaea archaeon]|nr:transglutaminase domain-containing protein [Hadesarchaea archaeon]
NLFVALSRAAGVPARKVDGTVKVEGEPSSIVANIGEGEKIGGHSWAEVYLFGERWITIDPTNSEFGGLPFEIVYGTTTKEKWREVLVNYELYFKDKVG